jgi:hypothetical protein
MTSRTIGPAVRNPPDSDIGIIPRMSKRRRLLIVMIGVAAAAGLGLELYTRWPSSAMTAKLDLDPDTRYVVLLFHGTQGRDEPTLIEVTDRFQRDIGAEPGVTVLHYIWSPWSDSNLRAGINGRYIGHALGEELAQLEHLQHIRLIAHSAGAYLLNPLCEAYTAMAEHPAHIEMTYLDSMGIRGGWDYTYGYRHYGECADYAGAIFSGDDFVPGTNAPLEHAHNIDVTNVPARDAYAGRGHVWPVQYFLDNLTPEEMTPGLRQ